MARPASQFVPHSPQKRSVSTRALDKVGSMLNVTLNKPIDVVRLTRKGIEPEAIDQLVAYGFARNDLSWIVAPRTLSHRRQKHERLTAEETGRWLRAARVHALALEVFGNPEKAMTWLHKPRKIFDGMSAMELMQTETGAQLAEETLGQLDAGYAA